MSRRLFVTGATGFVGRRVAARLAGGGRDVVALVRGTGELPASFGRVTGDLRRPETYVASLDGVATILHLAATTGAASAREHAAVNTEGTRALVECARAAGVRRFVVVSTIAAGFHDTRRYPYAASKRAAEDAVRGGGLASVVVRPAIVLGPGSAVLAGLRRIAALPVIPIFGPGTARVQPIDVDDLAALLVAIVDDDGLANETLELGGPEVLSIESLIRYIRRVERGSAGRVVHLPVGPIAAAAWFLEKTGLRPPLTAGQLATFVSDGTARLHPWVERAGVTRISLDETLRRSLARASRAGAPS